jgi:hypothetical protein
VGIGYLVGSGDYINDSLLIFRGILLGSGDYQLTVYLFIVGVSC